MQVVVICARCARVYVYRGGVSMCPKCHFERWLDLRALVKEANAESRKGPKAPASRQLFILLMQAAEFVEDGDIAEDVQSG